MSRDRANPPRIEILWLALPPQLRAMAEKKPRGRKKAAAKATKATNTRQPTLLTLFGGKRPTTSENVVDIGSDTDEGGPSEADSIVDVVGSSPPPPPPPQRPIGKGKRARQQECESNILPDPLHSTPSSPSSAPTRATSPLPPIRSTFSSTSTDVYSALRRSRARSIVAVDEDGSKPARGRTLFAVVRKSRSRPTLGEYTPTESQEGLERSQERPEGSQNAPIEILEEEPEPVVPLTGATVHAFFKPRKGKEKEKEKDKGKEKDKAVGATSVVAFGARVKPGKVRRDGDGLDPPWPNAESVHAGVKEDERLETRPCNMPRRTTISAPTSNPVTDGRTKAWAKSYAERPPDDILNLSPGWFDAWAGLRNPTSAPNETIPEEHAKHPAIARLLGPGGAQHAFAPPARACEVLGNEAPAQELADWLKKLKLRGKEEVLVEAKGKLRERRVIVTEVDRRKRRRVENQNEYDPSFAVDDFEDPDNYELIVELGNTFVVTGPPGTGKSAAVHACAQELGWSVFEVYAGIGRRGMGASGLASLIGSVGANHTVGGSGDGEVRQSLILLDEVDLVFGQDTQFWSAVVGLVRESRRPVVIVANDLFCIPLDDLPVHRNVEFQAADPALVGSYLYAQAQATGCARVPSRVQLQSVFEATVSAPRVPDFSVPDAPQHPLPSQLDRSRDLRRVLEDMKFWFVHGPDERMYAQDTPEDVREAWAACGRDVMECVGDWSADEIVRGDGDVPSTGLYQLWKFADSVSMVDAGLERRWTRQMQAEEVDRFAQGDDDEVLAGQLCKPWAGYEQVGIAEFCRDAEIALEAACTARRLLERSGAGRYAREGLKERRRWDSRQLEEVRAEHQERLALFLDAGLLTFASPLLPRAALVLDVIPAVHTMVAADDAMVASASRVVRGRNVRTSARVAAAVAGKLQQERYIALGEEELDAVRKTAYVT
ncbi:hypothetical protein FS749_007753 [Ceratobasidium sp. UAMH 11750]|nr:hypothetical protein FS749_007753 [Ceratobasidium sp. UAMH 11750]